MEQPILMEQEPPDTGDGGNSNVSSELEDKADPEGSHQGMGEENEINDDGRKRKNTDFSDTREQIRSEPDSEQGAVSPPSRELDHQASERPHKIPKLETKEDSVVRTEAQEGGEDISPCPSTMTSSPLNTKASPLSRFPPAPHPNSETSPMKRPTLNNDVSSSPGGIFDDADDDETFDLGVLKRISNTSVIVKPNPKPSPFPAGLVKKSAAFVTSKVKETAKTKVPDAKSPNTNQQKQTPTPKKRQSKPVRKVLVGKKEQDAAETLLQGKIDLLSILPEHDCRFLGEELWIFTLQQLESVISRSPETSDASEPRTRRSREARDELLLKLKSSTLLKQELSAEVTLPSGGADSPASSENSKSGSEESTDAKDTEKKNGGTGETEKPQSDGLGGTEKKQDSEISPEAMLEAAEGKVEAWRKAIYRWKLKHGDARKEASKTNFPLSGPLSSLFPVCTLRFALSVDMKTAYDFLILKKTETGLIVDMYRSWRQKCSLHDISALSLAKHLLGVANRLEAALKSDLSLDRLTREWMGSPLIVLTGAAKDFLISEAKIYSPHVFVETRTKDLSDKLVAWRIAKGLPALKGTGKVAMISAWKSVIKEAIDVESADGEVVTGVDFKKEVENATSTQAETTPVANEKKPDTKKPKAQPKKVQMPRTSGANNSPSLLPTLFDDSQMALMGSAGIITPQNLLDTLKKPDSPLVRAMLKKGCTAPDSTELLDSTGCVKLVLEWCELVQKKLESSEGTKPAAKSEVSPKASAPVRPLSSIRKDIHSDPYECLSSSTQRFLTSIRITTAESFLSARTTDVANAFVKWREENQMAPLKGLGAVASVSGWKSQVRKAVKGLGTGEKSSTTTSANNDGTSIVAKPTTDMKTLPVGDLQHNSLKDLTQSIKHPEPATSFSVEAAGQQFFRFELSVRRAPRNNGKRSYYLTYMGNYGSSESSLGSKESHTLPLGGEGGTSSPLTVMKHHSGTLGDVGGRQDFCSTKAGCGLVELSRYGVKPNALTDAETMKELKDALSKFVFQNMHSYQQADAASRIENWNVFGSFTEREQYFLFLEKPIEKGQTVRLSFLPTAPPDIFDDYKFLSFRMWMDEHIQQMKRQSLMNVLKFLEDEVAPSKFREYFRIVFFRRRLHWLATKIEKRIREDEKSSSGAVSSGPNTVAGSIATLKRWELWDRDSNVTGGDTKYSIEIRRMLSKETEEELLFEFAQQFRSFAATKPIWCPLAQTLFREALQVYTKFVDAASTHEKLVEDLCSLAEIASSKIKRATLDQTREDSGIMVDLQLTFRKETQHSCPLFPSSKDVFNASEIRASKSDAFENGSRTHLEEVDDDDDVCRAVALIDQNQERTIRTPTSLDSSVHTIDVTWYVQRQIVAILESVVKSAEVHPALKGKASQVCAAIRKVIESTFADKEMNLGTVPELMFPPICLPPTKINRTSDGNNNDAMHVPSSSQYFWRLVWPELRQNRWRLECGESPQDVCFFPPNRRKDSRARQLKYEAAKLRANIARLTHSIGLGSIPKPVKRLLIKCMEVKETKNAVPCKKPTSAAVQLFLSSLKTKLRHDPESYHRARNITGHVLTAFDKAAQSILYKEEVEELGAMLKEAKLSESLGPAFLLRLLVTVPNLLQNTDISLQQGDDVAGVIRELIDFMVENQEECFDATMRLPREEYLEEARFDPFLVARLEETKKAEERQKSMDMDGGSAAAAAAPDGGASETPGSIEVLLPADRPVLTDFVATVMSQALIGRATAEDMMRKGRRVQPGHPGLICRHCLGQSGEGKYFFSSIESLTTAATVLEKHVAKCPKISDDIKMRMVNARAIHPEQRKDLPSGAQGAFFGRLWTRLRAQRSTGSSNKLTGDAFVSVAGAFSDQHSRSPKAATADGDNGVAKAETPPVFKNHLAVMEYLQATSPWKEKPELVLAVERYYQCLYFGGRIYNTNVMPDHFSPEWLISNVAGKEYLKKR